VIVPRVRAFRPFLLLALIAALAAGAAPLPAAADGPDGEPSLSGRWAVRGALRDADDALAAGRLDQAGELYRQVVASTDAGDERRAEALYGVALVEALTPPGERAAARAAAALEELTSSFPGFERGPEVAAARSCLEEMSRAGGETERLAARVAELEAVLAERTARLAAEDAAAGDRVAELEAEGEALRAQVDQLRKKLSSVEAELKKKEEALDKVKQTLVGGG
jgi:hypothetical protein